MGIRSVEGLFTGIKGNITFNPSNLSNASFDVCIDASSINTENTKRDNHLKNKDFFQVDSFPTICFKSKSIVKSKEGYNVTGDLTMLGSTLEITFPFTYSSKYLKASFGLERLDFGLGIDYGSFMVGKTVEINISCYLK
jgi:polyisoprenoid-binding protein YceI